jgi:hypothetical protein
MTRFDKLFQTVKTQPQELEPELEDSPVVTTAISEPETQQIEPKKISESLAKSKDPKYVRTTIYISKDIHRHLKIATMDGEDDMSAVIESLVKTWLTENKHLNV